MTDDQPADTTRHTEIRAELSGFLDRDRNLLDSAVGPITFVAVNAFAGLGWAVVAASAAGALILVRRLATGATPGYAVGGLAATLGAALLALWLGRADGFFLPGIIANGVYVVADVVSVIVRRPLVAWTSIMVHRWPQDWFWRKDIRPAYTVVTWFWIAFWAARGGIQLAFVVADRLAALAAVKILTGWPLGIPLVIGSYLYGTRRLRSLGGPSVDEFRSEAPPPWVSQQTGF